MRSTTVLLLLLTLPCTTLTAQARPGDDFFGYANGDWLKRTTIPDGKQRWTGRNDIDTTTQRQLADLFESIKSAPANSLGGKVNAFIAASAEARTIAALQPQLDSIDRINDKLRLTLAIARDLGTDVDPINWGVYQSKHSLGLAIQPGLHGEPRNVVFLLPGTDDSLDAETGDSNAANYWSRADFTRRAPGMDWKAFFTAAGLGAVDTVVVWQPSAVVGLAERVNSKPLSWWKERLKQRLQERYLGATEQPRDAALAAMPEAIGQLYAERYFPAREKARLERIVAGVKAAFRRQVEANQWLSPASRTTALAKIDAIGFRVGYPDRWVDYSSLTLSPSDPIGNQQRIERWNHRRTLARLGKPIDRTQWWIAPHRVLAVLMFHTHSYNFPAAFLQSPKYGASASDAANYGAIGAIAGHEMSHYVDQLGADYGLKGELRHWWTDADAAGFANAAGALNRQVASYELTGGLHIDTLRTRTENVADLTGLLAAFAAHRAALGDRARDTAYVRQQDREFFLGFAHAWRGVIRDNALADVLQTDSHAPERNRVAIVRNLDAWYDAFAVQPGQALYLAPSARVRVW